MSAARTTAVVLMPGQVEQRLFTPEAMAGMVAEAQANAVVKDADEGKEFCILDLPKGFLDSSALYCRSACAWANVEATGAKIHVSQRPWCRAASRPPEAGAFSPFLQE